MKTLETSTSPTTIDATTLQDLGGRSQLLARMMRTGVRAGAASIGEAALPGLKFASIGAGAPALKFA